MATLSSFAGVCVGKSLPNKVVFIPLSYDKPRSYEDKLIRVLDNHDCGIIQLALSHSSHVNRTIRLS